MTNKNTGKKDLYGKDILVGDNVELHVDLTNEEDDKNGTVIVVNNKFVVKTKNVYIELSDLDECEIEVIS